MPSALFTADLGAGYALALRELWTVPGLHRVIVDNLDRLRTWEHWAHGDQTIDRGREFTRMQLLEWVDGRVLPAVILAAGDPVGTVGVRFDRYFGTAGLGYWIAGEHEGRGVVRRACTRVLDHVLHHEDVRRVEIRTATANERSRRLAQRLGFDHEGTLGSALRVGERQLDCAVYGLLPKQWHGGRPS